LGKLIEFFYIVLLHISELNIGMIMINVAK